MLNTYVKGLVGLVFFAFVLSACQPTDKPADDSKPLRFLAHSGDGQSGYDGEPLITSCSMAGPESVVAIVTSTAPATFIRAKDYCPDPKFPLSHVAMDVSVDEVLFGEMAPRGTLRFPDESTTYVENAPVGSMFILSARQSAGELWVASWVGVAVHDHDVAATEAINEGVVELSSDRDQLRAEFSPSALGTCEENNDIYHRSQKEFDAWVSQYDVCAPNVGPGGEADQGDTTGSDESP